MKGQGKYLTNDSERDDECECGSSFFYFIFLNNGERGCGRTPLQSSILGGECTMEATCGTCTGEGNGDFVRVSEGAPRGKSEERCVAGEKKKEKEKKEGRKKC